MVSLCWTRLRYSGTGSHVSDEVDFGISLCKGINLADVSLCKVINLPDVSLVSYVSHMYHD